MIPSSEKISKLLEQFYTDHDPEAFNALFSIFRQRVAVYIVKEFPQLEEEKEDILQEVALDLSRISA